MNTHRQDWINIAMGAWLIVSPWELDYAHMLPVAWNSYLAGLAVMGVAAAALSSPGIRKELANMALGLWLISSPWLLETHHHGAATANTFIVGLVVFALAASCLWPPRSAPQAHV